MLLRGRAAGSSGVGAIKCHFRVSDPLHLPLCAAVT